MTRLFADRPFLHPDAEISDTVFGAFVEIGRGSRVSGSSIGDYSYCDRYADIANADIGRFANIAAFTRIGPTDHPMDKASLHHFLYRSALYWDDVADDDAFFAARRARRCEIGHDTWIGHGAVVRPGLRIGHGAIVGAAAVITRDVPDYTIVVGNPARVLRPRFEPQIAARLLALAWWDWPHEKLRENLPDFRTLPVEDFLERHGG